MGLNARKPVFGFPTRSDTNQPVHSQKEARGLKFRSNEDEELVYPCSENKGTDQLCSYCTADLRFCFRIGKIPFSYKTAHLLVVKCVSIVYQIDECFSIMTIHAS